MRRTAATLLFSEMLFSLIKGNISLTDALYVLAQEGIEKNVRESAQLLLLLMKKGHGFSGSLGFLNKNVRFDPLYITLIASAELTGTIECVLEKIIGDLKRRQDASEKAFSILMYPAAIILIAVAGTVLLIVKGMPVFIASGILTGDVLKDAANGIITAGAVLLAGGTALFTAYYKIFYFNSPEFNIFYTLDFLLQNNVPLIDALSQCIEGMSGTKNGSALLKIKKEIVNGAPFSRAFGMLLHLPDYAAGWLSIADKNGNIGEICSNIKELFAHNDSRRRGIYSRLIEPAVIILTGIYLLILILTVIMPLLTYGGGIL